MKEYFDLKEIIELNNISKELKNRIHLYHLIMTTLLVE